MTIPAMSKRLAATGVATALTAGALVSGTAGPAVAAVSGGATYTCTVPLLNVPVDIPVTVSSDHLPTAVLADFGVPAGLVPVGGTMEITSLLTLLAAHLPGVSTLGANLPGFSMLMGGTAVPVPLGAPVGPVNALTALTGSVGGFKTPASAGSYDLELPGSFDLQPAGLPIPLPAMPCVLKDGEDAKVGRIEVNKQTSALAAKAVKRGKAVKASVVRQDANAATGKVAVFAKGKKVATKALTDGKATLKLTKVKGVRKVVVKYLGNRSTQAAKKTVTLR